jgi:hypothetical protein
MSEHASNEKSLRHESQWESCDAELSSLLTRRQPRFVPAAPRCANCQRSVYKAEEVRAANQLFHRLCFRSEIHKSSKILLLLLYYYYF